MRLFGLAAAFAIAAGPAAAIDLSRAGVERLDNGLTVIVLQENAFPVVSIQTVYKAGGAADPDGRMGLAHFFEHMAFRGSKNFPDTGLVSSIYAVGGEWHGYTWIDQTTYFATAPKEDLDLLLRIEADRMTALTIDPDEVSAEFGAVLAEMNGYENDPATVLFDAVMAAKFAVHPYRKNTIGFEGDIAAITHDDLVRFHRDLISPNNAVIAIVGDVDSDEVLARVRKLFGKAKPGTPVEPVPRSEPEYAAERRVRISGAVDEKLYRIAFPAPPATSDDLAAFLVLQEVVAAGAGLNFRQNDWGTPAPADSPLGRAAPGAASWFMATADPYVFLISGSAPADADERAIEGRIQRALDRFATGGISADELDEARAAVLRELTLDLETTEDAAHQLAFFEAIGALDRLTGLEEAVSLVSANDVTDAAARYLTPARRTVGWYIPAKSPDAPLPYGERKAAAVRSAQSAAGSPAPAPDLHVTDSGALIFAPSPLSNTVAIAYAAPGRLSCDTCTVDAPLMGWTQSMQSGLAAQTGEIAIRTQNGIANAKPFASPSPSGDPLARVYEVFADRFAPTESTVKPAAPIRVVAGAFEDAPNLPELILPPARGHMRTASGGDVTISMSEPKAQAALGYMADAPPLGSEKALAWQLALYMLSHGYEGRLGKRAISDRGLVYYIDAAYRSSESDGLITLATGVDPDKQDEMADLMRAELARLVSDPPDQEELDEAKAHLIGRRISAATSNPEIAGALAAEYAAFGRLRTLEEYRQAVEAVSLGELLAVLPAFMAGDIITVRVGAAAAKENGARE